MARLYPNTFPADSTSPAEGLVFAALQAALDDDWLVIHSAKWQTLDRQRRPQDGEADFVIAHPQHGILVLEVKGGGVRHDHNTGVWTTTDRYGVTSKIKDPFEQGKKNKYSLLHLLGAALQTGLYNVPLGHTVALPQVVVKPQLLTPDRPRSIILDSSDLTDVGRWLVAACAYYRGGMGVDRALLQQAVAALETILTLPLDLKPVLWSAFQPEKQEMLRLTQEQYTLLTFLNQRRRVTISGVAGSGKTMLAVEKAQRLARQGFSVLLTCYNKDLAADLRRQLVAHPDVTIQHFHALCSSLAQEAGVTVRGPWDEDYFNRRLPVALAEAAPKLDRRYDAIIVDEGQDFRDGWWPALQSLLADPEGILYIFYDDSQRIYTNEHKLPISDPPFLLTTNCRNTQSIHQKVLHFYRGAEREQLTVQGPPGREAETLRYFTYEQPGELLAELLRRLVEEEQIPAHEIAVLTPLGAKDSYLWRKPPAGPVRLSDEWPPPPGSAYRSTIQSFKGMERSVVILTEMERISGPPSRKAAMFYTAYSRACHHIILLQPAYGSESEAGLPPAEWYS